MRCLNAFSSNSVFTAQRQQRCRATHRHVALHASKGQKSTVIDELQGLGDTLGPIGLSYGAEVKAEPAPKAPKKLEKKAQSSGTGLIELGPIGMTYGSPVTETEVAEASTSSSAPENWKPKSIHSMTTAEWRAKYEKDGAVDLWIEEEFNAGSRLVGGRAAHFGSTYGLMTGEGPSLGNVAQHKVKIFDRFANQELELEVPEDRYVLWEAEDNGLELPYACRMGCCTACAVRVLEGEMYQPEALGISAELKEQGYALMCVGFPRSDLVLETVTEDEVYDLQFGRFFADQALDPNNPETIERDDYALQIANMDE